MTTKRLEKSMKVEGDPPRKLLFWFGSETKVAWTNIETVKTGRNE